MDPDFKSHVAKVPYANEWARRHKPPTADIASTLPGVQPRHGALSAGSIPLVEVVWDWTYSTDYCCSLAKKVEDNMDISLHNTPEAVISAKSLSSTTEPSMESVFSFDKPAQFKKISGSGINTEMLTQRQDILFYDEVILYEVATVLIIFQST